MKEPTVASINFGDLMAATEDLAEPAEFQPGVYPMVVGYCRPTFSKNGNFMYVVQLASAEGPTKNRTVKYHIVLNPENPTSIKFFLDKLKDLGVDEKFLASEPDENEVAGKICRAGRLNVTLKLRPYEDRMVPDVVRVRRPLQPQVS